MKIEILILWENMGGHLVFESENSNRKENKWRKIFGIG